MKKNKKGPLTAPDTTTNIIISANNNIVNADGDKNIITQISAESVFQRIPMKSTASSLLFISDSESVRRERYYSTTAYVLPSKDEFGNIPVQDGQATLPEKTSEYCANRYPMLPNLVCDFDCQKGDNGEPDEKDLDILTKHIIGLAEAINNGDIKLNKDIIVYFTGRRGYRLVIPYSVIGMNTYAPGSMAQVKKDMKHLAQRLIRHLVLNSDFLLDRLDRCSFTADRIMRAAYSVHSVTKLVAFPLDDLDIRSKIGIADVRTKARNLYDGKLKPIIFDSPNLEMNPVIHELYLEALKDGQRSHPSVSRLKYPMQLSTSIPDDNAAPEKRHGRGNSAASKCACLDYFVAHCDKLISGENSNRFEANFPFVLLANESGGERGVFDFHKAVARKIRPGQDATQTAEEWTAEIIRSLKDHRPSCKSYETPNGENMVGTYTRLNYLINTCIQKLPKFECNPDCPFRPRDVCINPSSEALNQWAVDFAHANTAISWQQSLYRYDEGYYKLLPDETVEKDISDYLGNHFTTARLKQIKEKIRTTSIVKNLNTPEEMICINNGVLDLKTFTVRPHTPELIFFGKIRIDYIPDSPPPKSDLLDSFLTNLFPEPRHQDDKNIMMKFAGYCFTTETGYGFAVVMTSDGNSGKTKFAMFLLGVLGEENYVAMDLNDISDPQHAEKLKNKRLCYVDEIGMSELLNDGCIKSRITGGIVSYNTKYKPTNEFKGTAKFLFGTNTPVIQTNDFSEGFLRRFVMVKFPINFDDPANRDKKVIDIEKLLLADQNAKDRFFFLAMEGLKELRRDGGLRIPDTKRRENRELLQANNMYHDFAGRFMFYSPGNRTLKSGIYGIACAYAKDNGKKIGSSKRFWQEIKRVMKCSIEPEVPETKYLKSGGHEYIKDIQIKGIKLRADKHQVEYITSDNRSMEDKDFIIYPFDVSVTEMTYQEYEARSPGAGSTQQTEAAELPDEPEEPLID